MTSLADRATRQDPNIKKVIIIERPARVDSLESVNKISNLCLKEEIANLGNSKVIFGVHNIEHQGFNKDQVFGQKSDRNDGVHFNGEWGKGVYADSLKNVLNTCGIGMKNKENI